MLVMLLTILKIILAGLTALFVLNFLLNAVLTYYGYDPKTTLKGCIFQKKWSIVLAALCWFIALNVGIYINNITDHAHMDIEKDKLIGIWTDNSSVFGLNEDGTISWFAGFLQNTKVGFWKTNQTERSIEIRNKAGDLNSRLSMGYRNDELILSVTYEVEPLLVVGSIFNKKCAEENNNEQLRKKSWKIDFLQRLNNYTIKEI